MAGWRIGFVAGNNEIIAAMNLLQDHLNCSQWAAVQEAAIAALDGPQECVRSLCEVYQHQRDTVVAPGVGFGAAGEGCVRVSLTTPAERLAEAARRIGRLSVF